MRFRPVVVSLLAACGGGSDDGSTPAPPAAATGTLRIALTDAPACGFDHVYVTVERVRVHQTSSANDNDAGWSEIVLNPAQRIDLLGLTNGVLAELGQTLLPAGQYTQVRLVLSPNGGGIPANAVVPTGGTETALDTPSATQSGLKLIHGFTVQPNTLTDLVLDFDACRSIVRKGNGGFNLKPVIAVIPRTTTGIVGTVDPALVGVTVSAQKNGVVVRSTTSSAGGNFVLSGLDPAQSPFDVAFAATGAYHHCRRGGVGDRGCDNTDQHHGRAGDAARLANRYCERQGYSGCSFGEHSRAASGRKRAED